MTAPTSGIEPPARRGDQAGRRPSQASRLAERRGQRPRRRRQESTP
jgi:hypothetical protein